MSGFTDRLSNLPPGVTDADIERQASGYEQMWRWCPKCCANVHPNHDCNGKADAPDFEESASTVDGMVISPAGWDNQVFFFPRGTDGNKPSGITVSKKPKLPDGDFHITEYIWANMTLWFVDQDNFTDDEREASHLAWQSQEYLKDGHDCPSLSIPDLPTDPRAQTDDQLAFHLEETEAAMEFACKAYREAREEWTRRMGAMTLEDFHKKPSIS